jgi:hypothetical protein
MSKRIRKIGIKAANAAMARGASKKEARIAGKIAVDEARKEGDHA